MLSRSLAAATLALISLTFAAPAAHAIPDGGYIGIGLGGAIASGDRGVPLKLGAARLTVTPGSAAYDEIVRTDFGSGMTFELRFGYLIAGVVAVELSAGGHGAFSFEEGAAYPAFVLRYHPVQHAIDHADRAWDLSVYAGVGYAIGGYQPEPVGIQADSVGWDGVAVLAGAGFAYQVADSVSIGVDLRFALPQYSSFIFDSDDDITFDPESTPSTLVVLPTAQVTFHL